MDNPSTPHILIIYTGGTIGMIENPETGALENFDFEQFKLHVPELRQFNYHIDALAFDPPIDSSDMEPRYWIKMAHIIADHYNHYDGFVLLHGTDTMAYTASALSYMLENLGKPVIITGSQLPIGQLRTDGKENLLTSIEIAAARDQMGHPVVPEAHAGIHIKYETHLIRRPRPDAPFRPHYLLDNNVMILTLFPGIRKEVIDTMLSVSGLRAVVMKTFGAGNAPQKPWFVESIRKLVNRGVIVVNITQCFKGTVEMHRYETGLQLLQAGVINGYDSTVEGMITKLMFLLGHGYSHNEIVRLMNTNIAGEITV